MTANAFAEDVLAAKTVGMNEHIAKPFDMKTIARTLNKWIQALDLQEEIVSGQNKIATSVNGIGDTVRSPKTIILSSGRRSRTLTTRTPILSFRFR